MNVPDVKHRLLLLMNFFLDDGKKQRCELTSCILAIPGHKVNSCSLSKSKMLFHVWYLCSLSVHVGGVYVWKCDRYKNGGSKQRKLWANCLLPPPWIAAAPRLLKHKWLLQVLSSWYHISKWESTVHPLVLYERRASLLTGRVRCSCCRQGPGYCLVAYL